MHIFLEPPTYKSSELNDLRPESRTSNHTFIFLLIDCYLLLFQRCFVVIAAIGTRLGS